MVKKMNKSMDSNDFEKRAVDVVEKFMKKSFEYTESYFDRFNWLFSEYVTTNRARKNPLQRANLKPPYAYSIVESFKPAVVDAFLADKNYVDVRGRGMEDVQFEEDIENFLSMQFDTMDLLTKWTVHVTEALLYGTAIAKVPWRFETRTKTREIEAINPETGEIETKKVKFMDIIKDGPDFEPVSIWDFFPDANSNVPGGIQQMKGCVHRSWKTIEDLEKNVKKTITNPDGTKVTRGIYSQKGIDQLKARLFNDNPDDVNNSTQKGSNEGLSNLERRDLSLGIDNEIKRQGLIEVLEYWGQFRKVRDGKPEEYVITIADSDVFLRADENPFDDKFKPFVAGIDTPIAGEFYGMGTVFPVHSLIQEGKALRNARLDQVNQGVNRMWIVDRTSGINVKNLYTRAGGIILANDINGIKPLDPSETIASAFREVQEIEINMQQAVGQTQPIGSQNRIAPGFGRTAQGVNFLQQITGSRVSMKIRTLAATSFLPFVEMIFALNQQFLMDDQWVRVNGKKENIFKMLPKDAFNRKFDFYANVAVDRLTRVERQQNLQQNILPLMQMGEQFRPGLIKWEEFIPATMMDFNYRDVQKFVLSAEDYQKVEQNRQQAQQQAQQQQFAMQQAMMQSQAQANMQSTAMKEQMKGEQKQNQNATSIQKEVIKQVGKLGDKVLEGGNEIGRSVLGIV